jgi:ketosteroid isomerase-like protein
LWIAESGQIRGKFVHFLRPRARGGCIDGMQTDEEAVRAVIARWEAAVQNRDIAGAIANHTDDMVMFDVPEPIQARGLAEYAETWELFFKYSPGGVDSFRLHQLEIIVDQSLAVAHALLDAGDDKCRLTTVLVRVHGEWMIAHEHHSSPWPNPRNEPSL